MKRGNPVGLGLVMIGAAVMAVSTFLPLYEPAGLFRMVQKNSLIQHGGWLLIVAAISIAGTSYNARNGKGWGAPFGIGVLAGGGLALFCMDKSQRTLYPVNPISGTVDSSGPGKVADFGIGIYVAGLGIAMVIVGSLMLRQVPQADGPDPLETAWSGDADASKKKCPDCAETILADAHVCKHCGFRFPASNLKCWKCQHVQSVLLTQQEYFCEECGAKLRRKVPEEGR